MSSPARRLFAATGNSDKLREFRRILAPTGWEIIGMEDGWNYPEPEETGATLAENALIKAREGYRRTGLPSFADDTGLEVDALDGRPGVYSSRYAGENVSYADNVRKLIAELDGIPIERRTARFRCVIAFVSDQFEDTWEGITEGVILDSSSGENGFGYDPVFWSPELSMSFADASPDLKHSVSHRGRALRQFGAFLAVFKKHLPTTYNQNNDPYLP